MKWPRGRYNGQRIVGVSFRVGVDLRFWLWLPSSLRRPTGMHWLCFLAFFEWVYED